MKLSNVCYFVSDKVKVSELNRSTYISTENMYPNRGGITLATSLPTTQKTNAFAKFDILVSNIRPYFKKIWKATNAGGCSNDILVFRAATGTYPAFLYYVLADDRFFDYATSTSKGTKMPRGDKVAIMEYEVPNCTLEHQRKIATILSALDDKIEQNNKINKNLEEQIHTIFNEHFGQNDYSSEEDTDLCNVCSCLLGGTPSRNRADFWGGTVPWINSGEVNNFRIIHPSEYISELGLKSSATKLLPAKTTVLAITGATLGQISLLEIETCANQSVVGVVPNERLPYEFIYPFIYANIQTLLSHQTGGAQQHINKQNVEQLKLKLPTKNAIFVYQNIVQPMFDKIAENMFESAHLAAIRDTLLPRLMSGEIDVSKVDISDPGCLDKLSFSDEGADGDK